MAKRKVWRYQRRNQKP